MDSDATVRGLICQGPDFAAGVGFNCKASVGFDYEAGMRGWAKSLASTFLQQPSRSTQPCSVHHCTTAMYICVIYDCARKVTAGDRGKKYPNIDESKFI